MKKPIPSIITSCSLLAGCIGTGLLFNNEVLLAAMMILIAAILDFFDGFVARLLNAKSNFGKELDSLADVVNFGILPGLIVFSLLQGVFSDSAGFGIYVPYIAFLIPIFSALRLAKFNTDPRQSDCFLGVPTPANALFIASIPYILAYQSDTIPAITLVLSNPGFIIGLIILLSFLLVAPLPLFAFKFHDLSWKKNYPKFILIFFSLLLLLIFHYVAVPIIFFLYILLSIIFNPLKK